MGEQFSWGKFFGGIIDPTAYFKTIATIIRIILIGLLLFAAYLFGVKIHSMLTPKKQQPAVFTVTGQQGGAVKNSADQKETKFGILNF